jgi:hypothetical protein
MMKYITLNTEVAIEGLVECLSDMPNEDLVELIKDVDKECMCLDSRAK